MYTLNWTKVTSHNHVLVDTTLPSKSFSWTTCKDVEETFNLKDVECECDYDYGVNLVYKGKIAKDWTMWKIPFTVHTTTTERQLLSTEPHRHCTETVHTAYVVTNVEKWEESGHWFIRPPAGVRH